jgi:hypothetical protein
LQPAAAATLVGSMLLGLSTQLLIDPRTTLPDLREAVLATLRRSLTA